MHAAQLLAAHLERLPVDPASWLELFAEDALVEFPYAASLGAPGRFEGRDAIRHYFFTALENFRGLTFSNARLYPGADPAFALAEVHGSATIASTGKSYEQDYVMVIEARGGRIARYREYWNPLPAIEALDLKGPR
jgi:uncharacterized protein